MSRPAALLMLGVTLAACGDDDGLSYTGEPTSTVTDYRDVVPVIALNVGNEPSDRPFLVDSGAPFTIIDSFAFPMLDGEGLWRADLRAWGVSVDRYQVVRVSVFGPGSGLDGILGGDFLRHFAVELDYRAATSLIWDPYHEREGEVILAFDLEGGGPAYVPCSTPFQCGTMDIAATRILMRARFEDQPEPINVLLDTGASAVVIDDAYYDLLEARYPERPHLDGINVDTVEGLLPGFLSRVWRMTVFDEHAEVSLESLPVLVIPGSDLLASLSIEVGRPVDAMIGGTFLRLHRTVIDYPRRRLLLERYDTTPHVPEDEFVQVGLELVLAGTEWAVSVVFSGSDAEAEGIVAGDVVETVDGMDAATLSEGQLRGLVFGRTLGTEVRLGLRRPPSDVVEEKLVLVEDLLPSFPPP